MAKAKSQTKIVNKIMEEVDLVHDTHGTAHAIWQEQSGKQVHPLDAAEVTHLISRYCLANDGNLPSKHIVDGIRNELAFYTTEKGQVKNIATRVGHHEGSVFLDLGKPGVMKVSKKKFELVEESEVLFRQSPLIASLPIPDMKAKGTAKRITRYVNVRKRDRILILSWAMSLFLPGGTYPLLAMYGKQGSAKSTTLTMLKQMLDPSEVPIIAMPKNEVALFIASKSYKMMPIDNVSKIGGNMSDAMCQLASGGSIAGRTLYTNSGLTVIDGHSLVSLNGIGLEISRQDLLSRTLVIEAPPLDGKHKPQKELVATFKKDHPVILGSMLKGVQLALNRLETVTSNSTHRMADFINWSIAWAPAFGLKESTVERRLLDNWKEGQRHGLASDRFASGFIEFIKNQKTFNGSTSELFDQMKLHAKVHDWDISFWPTSATGLGKRLSLLEDALKDTGISLKKSRNKKGTILTIKYKG